MAAAVPDDQMDSRHNKATVVWPRCRLTVQTVLTPVTAVLLG